MRELFLNSEQLQTFNSGDNDVISVVGSSGPPWNLRQGRRVQQRHHGNRRHHRLRHIHPPPLPPQSTHAKKCGELTLRPRPSSSSSQSSSSSRQPSREDMEWSSGAPASAASGYSHCNGDARNAAKTWLALPLPSLANVDSMLIS